ITASMATMITYTARLALDTVDPVRIGRYWAARVETMMRACVQDRALLPPDRSTDVRFDEFMAGDVATVARVYGMSGQPFTPAVERRMRDFMARNPRGRHGGVRYDLADFGLDRAERRAALRGYVERFGVAIEE